MAILANTVVNGNLRTNGIITTNELSVSGSLNVGGVAVSFLSAGSALSSYTTSNSYVTAKQVVDYITAKTVTPSRSGNTVSWSTGWVTAGNSTGSTTSRSASTGRINAISGVTLGNFLTTTASGNYGGFYGNGDVSTGTGWVTSGTTTSSNSSTYYIKSASPAFDGGGLVKGTASGGGLSGGGLSQGTASGGGLSGGAPSATSLGASIVTSTKTGDGTQITSGISDSYNATNYPYRINLTVSAKGYRAAVTRAEFSQTVTRAAVTRAEFSQKVTRNAVLYNGAVSGWVSKADNDTALAADNTGVTVSLGADSTTLGSTSSTVTLAAGSLAAETASSANTADDAIYIKAGGITNNTSGGSSSGTINRGNQIKIAAGWYPSDLYYTAQGAPTLSGDAAAENVLTGKTFYNTSYTKATGSMPSNSLGTHVNSMGKDSYGVYSYIPYGYYPSYSGKQGYAYVYHTSSSHNLVGDAGQGDVLTGKTFTSSAGVKLSGSMTNNGNVSKTLNTSTTSYTIPAGYHGGSGTVSISTETKSASGSGDITPSSGKVLSKVTVGAGSATTPATTITANPGNPTYNSSNGNYVLSVSASQSVTPTVSAGWVASGTAGTITVSGSKAIAAGAASIIGSLPSGATSTSLIDMGAVIKIGAGWYPSDLYYTAQSPSGNIQLTTSSSTNVSSYATATVKTATPSFTGGALSASATSVSTHTDASNVTTGSSTGMTLTFVIDTVAADVTRGAITYSGAVSGWVSASSGATAYSGTTASKEMTNISSTSGGSTTVNISGVTIPAGKTFTVNDGITTWTISRDSSGNVSVY